MVGARSFPRNPFDGHIVSAELEQTTNLMQDLGRHPTQAIVDLGYRGVDADNPGVQIIHRGKFKSLTRQQRRWLRRRQAITGLQLVAPHVRQQEVGACSATSPR